MSEVKSYFFLHLFKVSAWFGKQLCAVHVWLILLGFFGQIGLDVFLLCESLKIINHYLKEKKEESLIYLTVSSVHH